MQAAALICQNCTDIIFGYTQYKGKLRNFSSMPSFYEPLQAFKLGTFVKKTGFLHVKMVYEYDLYPKGRVVHVEIFVPMSLLKVL